MQAVIETKEELKEFSENKNHKKSSRLKFRLLIGLIAVFGITAALYFITGVIYQNIFFPSTTVNGINVSGLTPAQAQDAVNAAIGEYILTLEESDGNTEQISGYDIGLCIVDGNTLQDLLGSRNIFTWGFEYFTEKECSLEIEYDEEKLRSAIDSLSCMDKSKWVSPESAYINYETGSGYEVIPEIPGNIILPDKLFDAISEAVSKMEDNLSLKEAGVYKLPEISSEDSSLQEQLTLMQSYYDMTVTYQFGNQNEVLDGETICEWITFGKNGTITIDQEPVAQFVKELAKKYNTAYSAKTLETSYGETVTIKNGYYGWLLDKEAETDRLMDIIREGKSVTTEPAYLMEAASHDGPDYGNTYVEINLTAQHLFYYKDGVLVIESDFVSGNPSKGNDTPSGAYSVTYKERNATLRGQNYATPVSYWMPFNGNIGMHDSSWRSTFGGSIYKTNGSHGCINLPPVVAKTIYENIEQGIPVLCYHLGGTEQGHSTNLSGNEVPGPAVVPEPEPQLPALPEDGTLPSDIPPLPEEGTVIPDGQTLPESENIASDPPAAGDNIPNL